MTIQQLIKLKESEDKIEFKEAKNQYNYNNGRKSVLGYVCALANEGGGILAFGIKETKPYTLVNSQAYIGRIGQLEQNIYRDKAIRVKISELFDEHNNRVILIEIPSRPVGKMLYFDDVPLMRVGDRLERMNEEMYASIVMEKEPDFSAKICPELTLNDIDETAVRILKEKYALKQNNPDFKELPTEQLLKDLDLLTNEGLTNAALILLAKEEALKKYLPNAQVNIEYRKTLEQTHFDKRYTYLKPLFVGIDEIWKQLNARNLDHKINQNPYKFDIAYFNEEVVREAVLNAIAHRDYTINSEVVIKQSPEQMTITNAGGFPKGVNLDNLLTTNSTPRSRLLAQILEKTGLVERSGQGVDKIYRITLAEGKPGPDYSKSDMFQVELTLKAAMEDPAFAMFMYQLQADRGEENPIGTFKTIALHNIKEGKSEGINAQLLQELEQEELIKRSGGSASEKYVLADKYFDIKNTASEVGGFRIIDLERVLNVLKDNPVAKMKDFVAAFDNDLNREQVRYLIDKLVDVVIEKQGTGSGTTYSLKGGVIDLNNITDILKGA
ncbi:MAG: ATP-binding protein [Lutibacter sp.]|uniref:ATP-binding protein n=1 Tax=Lutibacter sp. TaxID=1925666 RepID=UPI00299F40D3|nr:ATP-binding protein [Lutibacter sp.]MDX1829300.1 ATP-binding protein [Lutibacter sp.]